MKNLILVGLMLASTTSFAADLVCKAEKTKEKFSIKNVESDQDHMSIDIKDMVTVFSFERESQDTVAWFTHLGLTWYEVSFKNRAFDKVMLDGKGKIDGTLEATDLNSKKHSQAIKCKFES